MVQPDLPLEVVEEIIFIFATEILDLLYDGRSPAQIVELAVVHSSWTPSVRRILLTNISLSSTCRDLPLLLNYLRTSLSPSADLVTSLNLNRVSPFELDTALSLVPNLAQLKVAIEDEPDR